jgi:hypothetical protein
MDVKDPVRRILGAALEFTGRALLDPGSVREINRGPRQEDFIPLPLSDAVGIAEREAVDVLKWLSEAKPDGTLDPTDFIAESAAERAGIEKRRILQVRLMLETLSDKYANALRTDALLEKVAAGKTGFVLLLRGFLTEGHYFPEVTLGWSRGDALYHLELAPKIAPVPLVYVRNPAESYFPAKNSYALDLNADWEAAVRSLASAASFICVHNSRASPGLSAEVRILRDLGRLGDTYFCDPEVARSLMADGPIQALDDTAIVHMGKFATRHVQLLAPRPNPTCLWLQGQSRIQERDYTLFLMALRDRWATHGQTMPRDIQTRLMGRALASSICLERLELMILMFGSYAHLLSEYRDDQLQHRERMVAFYNSVGESLARAIDQTVGAVFDFRDLNTAKTVMSNENPDELIKYTMQYFEALHKDGRWAVASTRFRRTSLRMCRIVKEPFQKMGYRLAYFLDKALAR